LGISKPAAKLRLGTAHPAILASLLYCGAGVVLPSIREAIVLTGQCAREVTVSRNQLPWLAGACQAGAANTELPVEGLNFLSKLEES
jgi:hypothetical protein